MRIVRKEEEEEEDSLIIFLNNCEPRRNDINKKKLA